MHHDLFLFSELCFFPRLHLVQYAVFLHGYLKEWRKNPHWSISCCLALLLPLNDLQGDIRGMTATDVLKSQLQTGDIDMPTILGVVKDSGAIDVTLEEGKQDDDHSQEVKQSNSYRGTKYSNAQYHRGTQTELSTVASVDILVEQHRVASDTWL